MKAISANCSTPSPTMMPACTATVRAGPAIPFHASASFALLPAISRQPESSHSPASGIEATQSGGPGSPSAIVSRSFSTR